MDDDNRNISRRRALKVLGVGGVVVATLALPSKWTRPVVETIVVPAHAQSSPRATTTTPGTDSDIRLKRDIVPVGKMDNGLTLYRFRYRWSDTIYVGVMAQEVLDVDPGAVILGEDGFYRVDYGRLGIRMMAWDEWLATTSKAAVAGAWERPATPCSAAIAAG